MTNNGPDNTNSILNTFSESHTSSIECIDTEQNFLPNTIRPVRVTHINLIVNYFVFVT